MRNNNAKQEEASRLKRVESAIRANRVVLRRWVSKKLGDDETAQEIVQESCARVWNYARENAINAPRALLFKTAANLTANEHQRRRRWRWVQPISGNDAGEEIDIACDAPTPERISIDRDRYAVSLAVIDAMPDKIRRAFVLSRFEDLTYREIADRMDVSVSSVEKYIIEAIRTLKDALDDAPQETTSAHRKTAALEKL